MRRILFTIFGVNIYGYGTMIAIGVIAAVMLVLHRAREKGYDEDKILNMAIFAVIGGVIGGKLLYILTSLDEVSKEKSILTLIGNGFVIYGSIIGGVVGVVWYCRKNKWEILKIFDMVIPGLALAQGFGRIGCFLAGCCYGKPTDLFFGVKFRPDSLGPSDVYVYPTQIFSSIFDFILALVLLKLDKKQKKDGRLFALYMIIYSVGRFIIEFIRNDPRGNVGILSTSQFIGIFVVILGIALYNIDKIKMMFTHKTADMK